MILDCFTFFNELDLLDIRLHTLSPYVDKFVISEADHTFQGQPKPFIFWESRHLFRDLSHKIIWCPVRFHTSTSHYSPWEREAWQRRSIRRQLMIEGNFVDSDHIILLSDVDEIPDLGKPANYAHPSWKEVVSLRRGPVVWIQNMTYYWVDLYAGPWHGTIAMKLGDIDQQLNGDFQKLREFRGATSAYLVYPGGWHFSYLGGVDAIKTKIEAFSHTEFRMAAERRNIEEATGERWKQGVDLFGRDLYRFRPLAAEERERLPGYLLRNRARFSGLFMPDGQDQGAAQPAGRGSAQDA